MNKNQDGHQDIVEDIVEKADFGTCKDFIHSKNDENKLTYQMCKFIERNDHKSK